MAKLDEPIKVGHLEVRYDWDGDDWCVIDHSSGEVVYRSDVGVSYLGGVTDAVAILNRETRNEREEMHVWLCDAAQVR